MYSCLQGEEWLARDLSQGANETSPSNELLPDPATSDRSTDSEDEEEALAEQAADTDMQEAAVTHLHPYTNGHLDPGVEAHQSSDDDGEQDTEDEQDGNEARDKVNQLAFALVTVMEKCMHLGTTQYLNGHHCST